MAKASKGGGHWVTINGGPVFIGGDGQRHYGAAAHEAAAKEGATHLGGAGGGSESVKEEQPSAIAERAKASHKVVDAEVQRYSEEHNEPRIAKALKGVSFPDSEPVDIVIAGKSGRVEHGIELKTITPLNDRGRIDMNAYSQVRKVNWERANKSTFHTVVVDDRKVFNAHGPGKHDESQRQFFYRRGVAGSARINAMHSVKTLDEVKALMSTPESKLPKGAQRSDGKVREGIWKALPATEGRGFKNSTTGAVVRPKK